MKKTILISTIGILFLSTLIILASADIPIQVCKVPPGPIQDPTPPLYPASSILFPVIIPSAFTGFQTTGCGAATFGASVERSNLLDITGAFMSRVAIVQSLAQAGRLSATHAGTFNDYINGVKTMLNRDPVNCYKLTIKRIRSYGDPVVTTLPSPTIETARNLQTVTYKPYNFRVSDIISAIQTVLLRGGVGLGGVQYDSSGTDIAAHMFQPVGINPTPINLPGGETRYAMKIYDPYFDLMKNVQISTDAQGRIFANIWSSNGVDRWFHLEELYTIENLGNCTNVTWYGQNNNTNNNTGGGGSGYYPIRGGRYKGPGDPVPPVNFLTPITPLRCGTLNPNTNACSVTAQCPQNQYCSAAGLCSCRSPVCGDGEKAPSEQCDDGNRNEEDACSNDCKIKIQCGLPGFPPTWVLPSEMECPIPGLECHRGSIITGICSDRCRCVPSNI